MTTIAVLSPGDMGHSVGNVLREHGARVITSLANRSQRTRDLARAAGIEDVPHLDDLVQEADVVLSILVPSYALHTAQAVADAIRRTETTLLYGDCNAIAPRTANAVGAVIAAAGARFSDAGIIGSPPPSEGNVFLSSGPHADELTSVLIQHGLSCRTISDQSGQASAVKMCYAAYTKGSQALATEILVAAEALGISEHLFALSGSINAQMPELRRSLLTMPPKAYRWVPEMEEIAQTMQDVGLTPKIHQGAADLYRFITPTGPGQESPENRDRTRDLQRLIRELTDALLTQTAPR